MNLCQLFVIMIREDLVNCLGYEADMGDGKGDIPLPKTRSFSRWPVATWPRMGSRLNGSPSGSSPIRPLG